MKVWGKLLPNGARIHIQGGIAPYKAIFSKDDKIIKIITNIPQANFFEPIYKDVDFKDYDDINCIVENLPPGNYKIIIKDSTSESIHIHSFITTNKKSLLLNRKLKLEKINFNEI